MRFLVWGLPCGFLTANFIWGFQCCIWYIASWPEMLHFQSIQPTRKDAAIDFQSNSLLRWLIMPCVSKPSWTHGIIVSLWLICYIQCYLSIYLSPIYISGIVAHDRCNISQSFTFFVQFQCAMLCCAFHLHNCFSEGSKTG